MRAELSTVSAVPQPELLLAFWGMVGVLAGVLGERVQRTRGRPGAHRARAGSGARRQRRHPSSPDHRACSPSTADGVVAYLNPGGRAGAEAAHARDARPPSGDGPARAAGRVARPGPGNARAPRAARPGRAHACSPRPAVPLPLGISTNLLMHEGTVTGVVAVFQDLTEVREMERRARRNETLAEVGALAAGDRARAAQRPQSDQRLGRMPAAGAQARGRERRAHGADRDASARGSTASSPTCSTYSREREPSPEALDLEDRRWRALCDEIGRDPRCGSGIQVRFERAGGSGHRAGRSASRSARCGSTWRRMRSMRWANAER